MSKIIKWATYENSDATQTLKQHAFHSVPYRNLDTGFEGEITISLCGLVKVGEGYLPHEATPISDIEDEVINLNTACKRCQRLFNYLNPTTHDTNKP